MLNALVNDMSEVNIDAALVGNSASWDHGRETFEMV